MAAARYDGHADWYDATFGFLGAETGSGGLVGRLLGPADQDGQICLDVGCGTGLHFRPTQARGYTVVGVDLSADQLRVAASRNRRLVRADAGRLPLRDASVAVVVMTFLHTDVDDFPATIGEVARVLSPGGRLVYLGVHPAYIGAFIDRTAETETQEVRVTAGYGDERLHRDPSGRSLSVAGWAFFWAGATGLALLTLAMTEAGEKDNFFRNRAVDTVKFTAFFTFFEAARCPLGSHHVRLFVYTIRSLMQDWPRLDKGQELRKLLMPIWLTLGAFPLVFIFALIADYEKVYIRMKVMNDWNRTSLRARLGVMLALRTRLLDIHAFGGQDARQAGRARSIRGGMEEVGAFRTERDGRLSRERSHLARLEALAGVEGTDLEGRQLDRREFEETQDALRWIASCQMGWYNQRKHYRRDLLLAGSNPTPSATRLHPAVVDVDEEGLRGRLLAAFSAPKVALSVLRGDRPVAVQVQSAEQGSMRLRHGCLLDRYGGCLRKRDPQRPAS
ncbi:MAG TPA: class I SAM-dependent methyltransferase [Mycobacteriales bacterium]